MPFHISKRLLLAKCLIHWECSHSHRLQRLYRDYTDTQIIQDNAQDKVVTWIKKILLAF